MERINQRLAKYGEEAERNLEELGFDIEEAPDLVYSTIVPLEELTAYNPESDEIYISKDPEQLSEFDYSELIAEIQTEIIRSRAADEAKMGEIVDTYRDAKRLENKALEPLDRIYGKITERRAERYGVDESNVGIPFFLEEYRDKLESGDEEAAERLFDEERESVMDNYLEEIGLDGDPDIEFNKKLLHENFSYLECGLEIQQNLEMFLRYQLKTSELAEDKVNQAASFLLRPLSHGELEEIALNRKDSFLKNVRVEDEEIEQILSGLMVSVTESEEKRDKERFIEAVEKSRAYWGT